MIDIFSFNTTFHSNNSLVLLSQCVLPPTKVLYTQRINDNILPHNQKKSKPYLHVRCDTHKNYIRVAKGMSTMLHSLWTCLEMQVYWTEIHNYIHHVTEITLDVSLGWSLAKVFKALKVWVVMAIIIGQVCVRPQSSSSW